MRAISAPSCTREVSSGSRPHPHRGVSCAPMHRAFLGLLLLAGLPAQRVWVVAPVAGAGVDFTVIQDAVNAAVDGDMILVRAGSYTSVSIRAKALTLVADGAVYGSNLEVADLAANQAVAVSGVTMITSSATPLRISNCLGPVSIQRGSFSLSAPTSPYFTGASIGGSTQVTLINCTVYAGSGLRGPAPGLMGFASTMHMYGCTVRGGSSDPSPRFPGTVGVNLSEAFLHANQCSFSGGNGAAGHNISGFCIPPTDGGDALRLNDAATTVHHLHSQFVPGQPGAPAQGCPPGNAGRPIFGPGTAIAMSGPTRGFGAAALVRTGQTARFDFLAPAGAGVWLGLAPRAQPFFLAACGGTFHLDLTTLTGVVLGTMPGNGQLSIAVPVPIQLGVDGVVLFSQAVFVNATAGCMLAGPATTVLVDSRF